MGERIAIVENTPGVTRDRIIADAEWQNHRFTLIDTGGIEIKTDNTIMHQMRVQAEIAIETADLILLLCKYYILKMFNISIFPLFIYLFINFFIEIGAIRGLSAPGRGRG